MANVRGGAVGGVNREREQSEMQNMYFFPRGGHVTYWVTVNRFAIPVSGWRSYMVPLSSFVKANDRASSVASRDLPVGNVSPNQALNHIHVKSGVPTRVVCNSSILVV